MTGRPAPRNQSRRPESRSIMLSDDEIEMPDQPHHYQAPPHDGNGNGNGSGKSGTYSLTVKARITK